MTAAGPPQGTRPLGGAARSDAPRETTGDVDDLPAADWEALPPWLDAAATTMLAQRDRWPHALLVTGAQGIGKRLLALHLAQALLCETPAADGRACRRCAACHWVERGTHPDLRVIAPVTYDDEGNATPADVIAVDAIRDLIAFAILSSHRGGAKVAVIAPAEALNASAANALLKTLEEPPPETSLILVSSQPGRVPATITSRCHRLAIAIPDREQAVAWLVGEGIAHPERVLALAGGAPLRAVALGADAAQRTRDWLLNELSRPERMSPVAGGARVEATPKDERKGMLADVVYGLLTWTADLAAVAAGGTPRFHPERGDALAELARRVARVPLFRYHRALLQQRALLTHPLQPRLVAEAMLFEYRSLFGKR